ncbi:hypothetical protein O6H91_06G007000 [Diphasiastrum complanatum]|uniref:Uncharacterized protein n=1 Tax=Diphasiastrum complanatum TaxID=34168 RepID=A0ACC2DB98_DIPCM|nr:hypothetical protein O6H91_06G007000 [Diphasiastrum complanatum]
MSRNRVFGSRGNSDSHNKRRSLTACMHPELQLYPEKAAEYHHIDEKEVADDFISKNLLAEGVGDKMTAEAQDLSLIKSESESNDPHLKISIDVCSKSQASTKTKDMIKTAPNCSEIESRLTKVEERISEIGKNYDRVQERLGDIKLETVEQIKVHIERVENQIEEIPARQTLRLGDLKSHVQQSQKTLSDNLEQVDSSIKCLQEAMNDLKIKADKLSYISYIQMKIGMANLSYMTVGITKEQEAQFRKNALKFYGYSKSEYEGSESRMYCIVLNQTVPAVCVVTPHLFKPEWAAVAWDVMGFENINNPRNALPMYCAIAEAYDTLRLCFISKKNELLCYVLDPNLIRKPIISLACDNCKLIKEPDSALAASVTFEKMNREPVIGFANNQRPFRRVLNFHARQALAHAVSQSWYSPNWQFTDYYSDDDELLNWAEKVEPLLGHLHHSKSSSSH